MKIIIISVYILSIFIQVNAQVETSIAWSFKTKGKILSHPIIEENRICFGSDDQIFYSVDINTGKQIWAFQTQSPIRSKPIFFDDMVIFKSGSDIYALDKIEGIEIWSWNGKPDSNEVQMDYWDYHSGSPAIYNDIIYFGFSSGEINGYKLETGDLVEKFTTIDSASVKCGLVIDESILYLGDWKGKIYAFDLVTGNNLWIYETYEEQPYETFGQINTQLLVYEDLLLFGGRNPTLQILDKKTGDIKWDYVQTDGGWISGDPVVKNDTLFIGGSDTHEMFAFDVHTGTKYWEYLFSNNNFSKPLPYKDVLLFTTGDAYTVFGESKGRGYLYAVNRKDGTIINFDLIGGNIYSSPVVENEELYLVSEDENLYAIDLVKFLNPTTSLNEKGYNSFEILELSPPQFIDSLQITYQVNYETDIEIILTDLSEVEIKNIFSGTNKPGTHSITYDCLDNYGNTIAEGYYFIEVNSKQFYKRFLTQKSNKKD